MGKKGDKETTKGGRLAEGLLPRLTALRTVTSKKMFGGYGFFQAGKMFGLVTSGAEFFLKVNDSNRPAFTKARAPQHGKMPYFRVPKSVLTDDAKLLEWARASVKIAHGK